MGTSVVVPAWNDAPVIVNAIDSVLRQTGLDDVVVVDDGSEDSTCERVRAATGPVRCIAQAHAGPAAARNRGARLVASEYLVFLDADDLMLEGALERFAAAHADGARLVRAASCSTGTQGDVVAFLPRRSGHPYPRGTPLAGSFSVETETFHQVGGYDPELRYGENSELLMRLSMHLDSSEVAYLTEPSVRITRRTGRVDDHYDAVRLAAVHRMLDIHGAVLASDPETLRAHLLIASNLHRRGRQPVEAVRLAARAAGVGPFEFRSLFRIGRAALPPLNKK